MSEAVVPRHTPLRLWSIRLILAGLVIEILSLFVLHHPVGFLMFALGGCSFLVAGVVAFVISVFRVGRTS